MDHSEYTLVDLLYDKVDVAYHRWSEIAEYFGEAYRQAYKTHKGVESATPLGHQIAGEVLNLVTWGSMKWLGMLVESQVAKKKVSKTFKDWLYEPAIEVGKAISSNAHSAMQQKVRAQAEIRLPADPENYKSNLKSNIEAAIGTQKQFLTELKSRCSDKGAASSEFKHGMYMAERSCWCLHYPEPQKIKEQQQKLQTQMELCMWLKWIKNAGTRRWTTQTKHPTQSGYKVVYKTRQVPKTGGPKVEVHLLKHWGKDGATMGRSENWQSWPYWLQRTMPDEREHLYDWATSELHRRQRANSATDTKSGVGSKLPAFVKQNWGL